MHKKPIIPPNAKQKMVLYGLCKYLKNKIRAKPAPKQYVTAVNLNPNIAPKRNPAQKIT